MNHAQQIADEIVQFIVSRAWVTKGTREELRALVRDKVAPLIPSWQGALSFGDTAAFDGQSAAILKLLKQRRSQGATNAELSAISLKYTGRVSDLRKQGYRILCQRVGDGRTFEYRLSPEMW